MWNPLHPKPAPPAFGKDKIVPIQTASWLSKLTFYWLDAFLGVGFTRPLEKDDLWTLPDNLLVANLTDGVERDFYGQQPLSKRPLQYRRDTSLPHVPEPAAENVDLEKQESSPTPTVTPIADEDGKASSPKPDDKWDISLAMALQRDQYWRFRIGGLLQLCSETLRTCQPLVTKLLLTWLVNSYVYPKLDPASQAAGVVPEPQGIGYGIALAFGIFLMSEGASILSNHAIFMNWEMGMSWRAACVGAITRKSLRLSGRSRLKHSVGQITTMISIDAGRLELVTQLLHYIWIGPIEIIVSLGLLIWTLGYSALAGLAILLLGMPIQVILIRVMFSQHAKTVVFSDGRTRLITEVLGGIRLIKFFGWESFYQKQVLKFRTKEITAIKDEAVARSALIGSVYLVPSFATVFSFIVYSLSGHDLTVATIFTSLQFFNILNFPLFILPFAISMTTDALVSLKRITPFLVAEELEDPFETNPDAPYAIDVDGDFTWEKASKNDDGILTADDTKSDKAQADKEAKKAKKSAKKSKIPTDDKNTLPISTSDAAPEKKKDPDEDDQGPPFALNNLRFTVPKKSFVAIVGRVGSGKSSVLSALIGEMRRTSGKITFGGSVAYVPQTPWIRNATLRDNILFGRPRDDEKFNHIVDSCALAHDLEVLPHGEDTEIGEKGINLSGGQKARVSLARAAYSDADIVLLDDCLSAVDAYVGKHILNRCLLDGPLASKTRILVTHALHVLNKADYIYVMGDSGIVGQGTYEDLMRNHQVFRTLIEDYGSQDQNDSTDESQAVGPVAGEEKKASPEKEAMAALMQEEERQTGAVPWSTYSKYLHAAGGLYWAPIFLILLMATAGAQVGTTIFLGLWTAQSISGFSQGQYMAVYAALGVTTGVIAFVLGLAFSFASLNASLSLFTTALDRVLRSPTSFFDTTPTGRILSRMSKDFDTMDSELSMTTFQFLSTLFNILGIVALVFYTFPLLGVIFVPMIILYGTAGLFYRRTSVETKRLDSIMRSGLYAAVAETLTGLSTVRAYRDQERCIKEAEKGLDMENRAYFMTLSLLPWLGIRLDLLGNVLLLGICLFAVGFRESVDPSKIGVVISYALTIAHIFSMIVSQFAQNEQNMNAVERVLEYTKLVNEGNVPDFKTPSASWPDQGSVIFKDVDLAYRPGLPLVLKKVSFEIKAGEKIGIVGRTGAGEYATTFLQEESDDVFAGKSSLMQALFRIVELESGQIDIDGQNIKDVDLTLLRQRLALVPQENTLFMGTLRDNIDPERTRTDAELIANLQRASLLPPAGAAVDPVVEKKFSLDADVGDEGSNFSAGEKQLLALCRALVKASRILVLDEATSNVDVETDGKVQQTIQKEFKSSTVLCIAHRLNTIAHMDRILVMDKGQVAEFDTPLNLFDIQTSIFRSLCDDASLSRADIERLRNESYR